MSARTRTQKSDNLDNLQPLQLNSFLKNKPISYISSLMYNEKKRLKTNNKKKKIPNNIDLSKIYIYEMYSISMLMMAGDNTSKHA